MRSQAVTQDLPRLSSSVLRSVTEQCAASSPKIGPFRSDCQGSTFQQHRVIAGRVSILVFQGQQDEAIDVPEGACVNSELLEASLSAAGLSDLRLGIYRTRNKWRKILASASILPGPRFGTKVIVALTKPPTTVPSGSDAPPASVALVPHNIARTYVHNVPEPAVSGRGVSPEPPRV